MVTMELAKLSATTPPPKRNASHRMLKEPSSPGRGTLNRMLKGLAEEVCS